MTKKLTHIALIAAVYAALTCLLGPISFGIVQFRIAEVLMVFAIFEFDYIYGLTLGCILANFLGVVLGSNTIGVIDIIFGACATFISGVLMHQTKNIKISNIPLLALIIPVIVNAIIIGLELAFVFASKETMLHYWFIYGLDVALGEFVSVSILGFFILKSKALKEIQNG